MLPATITTAELRRLTGFSAPALVDLERRGVIRRAAKNSWPIETLPLLVRHLRDRHAHRNIADEQWRAARAAGQELRNQERLGQLTPSVFLLNILDELVGQLRAEFSSLPAMYSRDVMERRKLDDLLRAVLGRLSGHFAEKTAKIRQANQGKAA